jgi:UDP-N-acetylglucosamine 2-epimerase (non-hydrolysing)
VDANNGLPFFLGKMSKQINKVLTIFGTRPEIIKLAPIIQELEREGSSFQTVNVTSAQHTDLLYPFIRQFGIRVDYDLHIMEPDQTLNQICSLVITALDGVLVKEQPHLILVQGDTTTAMAGALAGFHRRIPVGHVEAGLRSGNIYSPFPEEMNRRLITHLATYHFAATTRNRSTLLSEGVSPDNCFVTGNPIVDALLTILRESSASHSVHEVVASTNGLKRIVLTTHRRESFGEVMAGNLAVLRRFVEDRNDVALIFPVHPNPSVHALSEALLSKHPRIHLIQPLGYRDFIHLLTHDWLIVSDSGGLQEEAPTLGKPLLIIRENTERPEAVECGVARLVGGRPAILGKILEEVYTDRVWIEQVGKISNPFGQGKSAKCIVQIIRELLRVC